MQYNWFYQLFCENTTFTVFARLLKKTVNFTHSCASAQKSLILRVTNVKTTKSHASYDPKGA